MFKYIEINNSLLHRVRQNHQPILKNISNELPSQECCEPIQERKAVPLKEYSNKFLRDSQFNSKQKECDKSTKYSRINNLITKHKFFQKKLIGAINKNVCKTEPNQNQYKCFMTSKNFYRERDHIRTQTENINPKVANNFFQFQNEDWKRNDSESDMKGLKSKIENRIKSKMDILLMGKPQQKISASRALQMYAKIISKDRSELIEKIKFTNQKKQTKDDKLESKKNLQICQINLQEKQKKYSLVDKIQQKEKLDTKSLLKFRKKTKSVDHRNHIKQQENFELKGWDS